MTSTIEKEGNLLPHNTTEEVIKTKPEDFRTRFDKTFKKWHDGDNVLKPLVIEFIEQEKEISHNLALQQVVEVLKREKDAYELAYKKIPNETSYPVRIDQIDDLQSIITSLQKE